MNPLTRRAFVAGVLAATLAAPRMVARAHSTAGIVSPPSAPPRVDLTLDDGKNSSLKRVLLGRVSAVQLMFTSCGATCPIQGAVFAEAAAQSADKIADAQWLSVSIDPERDKPDALRSWMQKFGAHPRWRAGRPDPRHLGPLVDFLKAQNEGPDKHTAQVFFFNRKAELVMRSVDFPPAAEILRVLERTARAA